MELCWVLRPCGEWGFRTGGTIGPMFQAISAPTRLNVFSASIVAPNYMHSLFYDCKPLKKK